MLTPCSWFIGGHLEPSDCGVDIGDDGSDDDGVDWSESDGDDEGDGHDGEESDDAGDEMDGDDEGWSHGSRSFLLLIPLLSFPVFSSPTIYSLSRFTSDNFTGFTMKSSAPSSKHLSILATTFSDDIITTGISLKVDDS